MLVAAEDLEEERMPGMVRHVVEEECACGREEVCPSKNTDKKCPQLEKKEARQVVADASRHPDSRRKKVWVEADD